VPPRVSLYPYGVRFREILIAVAVLSAVLAGSASASAADFTMKFDDAYMQAGWRPQSPGVNHFNDVYMPPDDVVVFSGTDEDGAITVPAAGVAIKDEIVTIEPEVRYFRIEWRATTPFTGTYDAGTGQLDLSGSLEQTVSDGGNVCTTGPLKLELSTETDYTNNVGVRFVDGLEGPGTLTGSRSGVPLPETGGASCDRENMNCYARTSIAGQSMSAAFATSGSLIRGVASLEICDPPTVPTSKPRVTRTKYGLRYVSGSGVGDIARVICPGPLVPCQITSATSRVKVRGRKFRSEVRVKRGPLAAGETAKANLRIGPNARKRLIKGVKSGSAEVTFRVRSDDESIGTVEKTIRVGLTR